MQHLQQNDLLLMRLVLAVVWIVTGVLSLGLFPQQESLNMLAEVGLHGSAARSALYVSAWLDIVFGILTIIRPAFWLWRLQAAVVIVYSTIIALYLPYYWLHPFGPVLKNLTIVLMLWLLHKYERRPV